MRRDGAGEGTTATSPERRAPLRIGTRGSALALAQTRQIASELEAAGSVVELVVVRTSGDRLLDAPLALVGGKGLFIKELEEKLLDGVIDVAVHSMKDVPTVVAPGLAIGAVPERAPVHDVLVLRETPAGEGSTPLDHLGRGARIGTGSLRRGAQLAALRSDLEVVPLRGNVDTRLRRLAGGEVDGVLLAAAGLLRLGLSLPALRLEPEAFVPAPGQGALALEVRESDERTRRALAPLHDERAAAECAAERAFARALGASCVSPIGALARAQGRAADAGIAVQGLVATPDGRRVLRRSATGVAGEATAVGERLGRELLEAGAAEILAEAARTAGD